MFKLSELEPLFRHSIETYQRTQAAEEGRFISFSKALRECRLAMLGISRGIYEYRGEARPNNVLHTEDGALETVIFGTK